MGRNQRIPTDRARLSEVGDAGITLRGADIIIAPSNDGVFTAPGIAATHHTMARMRALESQAYLLRAVRGGRSSIIAPSGDVLAQTDNSGVLFADIGVNCRR